MNNTILWLIWYKANSTIERSEIPQLPNDSIVRISGTFNEILKEDFNLLSDISPDVHFLLPFFFELPHTLIVHFSIIF